MNLSVIAFGAMTIFAIVFLAAMFLIEWNSNPAEFPKSDITEAEDDNPFKVAD